MTAEVPNKLHLYDPLNTKNTCHQQRIHLGFHLHNDAKVLCIIFFQNIWQKKKGGRGKGREILQIIKRQTLAINQTDRDAFEILHEFQPLRFIQNRQNLNPMLQCTAKDCAGLCACSCFIYLHFSTGTGEIFFNRVNIVGNWRC